MSWTRLDDGWTDRPVLAGLPYDVRWHYLALVQFCSRTSRYDGLVRGADARRCSDVIDPAGALQTLVDHGLLVLEEDGYRVVQIDEHVLPPHLRDEQRKASQRERKRRERAHRTGNHAYCQPDRCEEVTRDITSDVGTGRDGQGSPPAVTKDVTRDASWPPVAQPGADEPTLHEALGTEPATRHAQPTATTCSSCGKRLIPVTPDETRHPWCADEQAA